MVYVRVNDPYALDRPPGLTIIACGERSSFVEGLPRPAQRPLPCAVVLSALRGHGPRAVLFLWPGPRAVVLS